MFSEKLVFLNKNVGFRVVESSIPERTGFYWPLLVHETACIIGQLQFIRCITLTPGKLIAHVFKRDRLCIVLTCKFEVLKPAIPPSPPCLHIGFCATTEVEY